MGKLSLLALFTILVSSTLSAGNWTPHSPATAGFVLLQAENIQKQNPDWSIFRVKGNSMNPFFGEQSIIMVRPLEFSEVRKNMIILFKDSEGDLVIHKVMEVNAEGIVTKGSNNLKKDPRMVTTDNLIGGLVATFHMNEKIEDTIYLAATGQPLPTAYAKRGLR